jgi:NADH-quinone oxidoreductase subunit L
VFAYGAGLFHLMTHAFFKALLFMGAGSVIGAMAGNQNIDRMGGFRRAMPFTFATFTIGALALSGFPFFSGFFSKDEIIGAAFDRGGLYAVLAVLASIAAGFTAFYAFRMVFRVFFGEPVPEALELERGHMVHHEPANPVTGEPEDTEVGFPGPEHHVAEQELPMKVAMGTLAVLSIVGGLIQIPGVSDGIEKFLEPSFADSEHFSQGPSHSAEWVGLAIGGVIALLGIGAAYSVYMRRPGTTLAWRDRFAGVHAFLFNKWYFDELYDRAFVRPALAAGRFGRDVVERRVVQDVVMGWATGLVRSCSRFVREIQSGYIRAYALLFLMGMSSLGLYFLIVSG